MGKLIQGRLEAANDADLETRLGKMKLELVGFREQKKSANPLSKQRINRRDLITFCFFLEQQYNSGVPILDSLQDIRESMDNLQFRSVVASLVESIEGGKTLSQALEGFPHVFDGVFVSVIRAGESSSQLDEVLRTLIASLKWQDELAAQTKKMLMYPAVVGGIILSVSSYLMIFLVPQITNFLKNTGQPIPWYTQSLINTSEFMGNYWYLIFSTPFIIFYGIKIWSKKDPRFRLQLDRLKLKLFIIGPIYNKIILSRFTNYFALLYKSGITVLNALKTCEDIVGNQYIREAIATAGKQIETGGSITESFENTGIFPRLILRMMKVGESTGAIDKALNNVSYFYNREVKESIDKLQTLIEPILMVVMAFILGWIAVSILFPIWNMVGSVNG